MLSSQFYRSRLPTTFISHKSRHNPVNIYAIKPAPRPWGQATAVRNATFEAGEDKSGHISAGKNEGIFFVDNIFPLKLQWLFRLPLTSPDESMTELLQRFNKPNFAIADPLRIVRSALPEKLPIKVTEVIPRLREGGAFVKFAHDEKIPTSEVEATVNSHLQEKPINPWFNPLTPVHAHLVKGRPWLEDLYRFPSSRLKVEFLPTRPEATAAELTQESLFALFRRYGKLGEIIAQHSDSKVLPKYAYIDFARVRYAIMAKNCMHGLTIGEASGGGRDGTVLKLTFEQKVKAHWIRDWFTGHPRIVLPILAAIFTGVAVAVFDPIRTFFIKTHVSQTFHLKGNKVWKWVRKQVIVAGNAFSLHQRKEANDSLDATFDDRRASVEQLQTWLMETADTFIVIQGPRGSGKKEMVLHQALHDRRNKLVIDCKPIQEAHGDTATIAVIAKQVGYRPVFSWMNSVSSLIDLAAQGTIGTKTGFSETLDGQFSKIFGNTATALREIALEGRKKDDKDSNLGDDEYLEAHPEKRPVVIIDNFLHKSNESSNVYDKVSEWAASLTTTNIAHVIFLTNEVSFTKSLSKALPDRVFRQITLGDLSAEAAKRFVVKHLDSDPDDMIEADEGKKLLPSQRREDLGELDSCIETLGGRLTDLEFLARRLKSGETPQKAVFEIIEQSASEILKLYLLDIDANRSWTSQQAWVLIKELAKAGNQSLRYNELLLLDLFKDRGEKTLQALEQAELISIASYNGRPQSIKPGKPVYQAAFKFLTEDSVLRSRLELAVLSQLTTMENKTIEKCEDELKTLAELPGQSKELRSRIQWLLVKAAASQEKVEAYEKDSARLKKVLQVEY